MPEHWRRDGTLHGCTLTNPTSGALSQFSSWHLNSPLCQKSLSQEHRASLLQARGKPALSLPSRPSPSVSLLKKAQIS